jgi:hypothetical protein
MSNNNGLVASTDVCSTGSPESNFFVRVGEPIVVPDPLQIISPNGAEVLSLGISNAGNASIENQSLTGTTTLTGNGAVSVVSDAVVNINAGTNAVITATGTLQTNTAGVLITSTGNENHNITGSVSITASAGETHNITGNFGVTATGTASVIASGNTTVGGQNVFLSGNSVNTTGYLTTKPPAGLSTNGSGGVSISNGTAGTAPNTSYTFWAEGDVPNAGRTPGNLDLIRINGAGSLPLLNITPAGDVTLEPAGATLSAPEIRATNPITEVINPSNTTGVASNNLKPLLWDSTTKQLVIPSTPLIRYFRVNTPDSTGNQVDIIDPQGNAYNLPDWVCCIAGFANGSNDRTYQAFCLPYANSTWKVEYDTAGSGNQVWILAISTALLGSIQY